MHKPLIHVIGNHVSRAFVADGIHAYGGSPIMSEWPSEFHTLHQHAKALIISLGMLDDEKMTCIEAAVQSANTHGLVVGIDPVGIHLSEERRTFCVHLLENYAIDYVRGNFDEVHTLLFDKQTLKNPSLEAENEFDTEATPFHQTLFIATGAEDRVYHNGQVHKVPGGSEKLRDISGAGCLLSALIAIGILKHGAVLSGATQTLVDFKKAAEKGASLGIGHFKSALLDHLYALKS